MYHLHAWSAALTVCLAETLSTALAFVEVEVKGLFSHALGAEIEEQSVASALVEFALKGMAVPALVSSARLRFEIDGSIAETGFEPGSGVVSDRPWSEAINEAIGPMFEVGSVAGVGTSAEIEAEVRVLPKPTASSMPVGSDETHVQLISLEVCKSDSCHPHLLARDADDK